MKYIFCLVVGVLAAPTLAQQQDDIGPHQKAQSRPAVDGVNGKLSLSGIFGDADGYAATGSYTAPLGHRYGFQLDGIAARSNIDGAGDVDVLGAGFHVFWRDPSKGLLGIVGSYVNFGNELSADLFQGGIEGAYYRNRFSIDAVAGATFGDDFDTDFYIRTVVSHYPTDNISLQLGHSYQNDDNALLVSGELAFNTQSKNASSLFVSGKLREGGGSFVATGLRFYFGNSGKTLIRRHREDDPPSLLTGINIDDWTCTFRPPAGMADVKYPAGICRVNPPP